jgi:hypothetical protein
MQLFNTGSLVLQNGGTFTDAGFRLDVNGTSRHNGQTTLTGSVTATGALAQGIIATPTLVASANSDVLVGMDINPIYNIGAFTGVLQFGLRVVTRNSAQIALGGTNQAGQVVFARGSDGAFQGSIGYTSGATASDFAIRSGGGSGTLAFDNNTGRIAQFFSTGNFTLQNGGTFTDIPTARLAVNSTTQGFLPPRMTTTEKNAIASPATGLVVFDTTLGKLCVFATTWQTITST